MNKPKMKIHQQTNSIKVAKASDIFGLENNKD